LDTRERDPRQILTSGTVELVQRKLAAIMAADVVGYSRLMRADETSTLTAMKALWSEVVQPSVRTHRGRVFKLMGDGMLAEFSSVVDAANAAEAIQIAANERASGQAEDKGIRLRIGINLGDVVVDGSDLYGDGVNIAARLQEVAPVGGIAVSATTCEYLQGKTEFVFADAGERSLKNIDQPIQVWLWPAAGGATPQAVTTPNRSSQPSIVVLPFENLSADPDQEFFADGMAEEIITILSKIGRLRVIARQSTAVFKGKAHDFDQISGQLNVQYILDGSIRRSGARLRVSAQLIDSNDGSHVWVDRYDRSIDDIFDIQDEITKEIVTALRTQLTDDESAVSWGRETENVDAWQCFCQALDLYLRYNSTAYLDARRYAEKQLNSIQTTLLPGVYWAPRIGGTGGWASSVK
jgi:adenylate cyclase